MQLFYQLQQVSISKLNNLGQISQVEHSSRMRKETDQNLNNEKHSNDNSILEDSKIGIHNKSKYQDDGNDNDHVYLE